MAQLADVFLDLVENEIVDNPYTITEKPVEGGQNVVDHVRKENERLRITGIIQGEDWQERYQRLKQIADENISFTFQGKKFFAPALIESINEDYSRRVIDGFPFIIIMVKPRFAMRQTEELLSPDPVSPDPPAGAAATRTQTQNTKAAVKEQPENTPVAIENVLNPQYGSALIRAAAEESQKRQMVDVVSGQIPFPRGNTALNTIPGGGGR